jgi:hypothetical protein
MQRITPITKAANLTMMGKFLHESHKRPYQPHLSSCELLIENSEMRKHATIIINAKTILENVVSMMMTIPSSFSQFNSCSSARTILICGIIPRLSHKGIRQCGPDC